METKTFKENAQTKGVKEGQEESRDRFAYRLEEVMRRYTNRDGGERSFEKGRRHVFKTISQRLQNGVDDIFIEELVRHRAQFSQDPAAPEHGTVLTRLLAEVDWMLDDEGTLRKIHRGVAQCVSALAEEQSQRNDHYNWAIQRLRGSKRSGFFNIGAWVEEYQQAARDECSDYIRWYQKHELLKDLQRLVLIVEERLREWARVLGQLLDTLVRREGGKGEASALFTVTEFYLKGLEGRLYRAARTRSALISFGEGPDPQMHGYQEELRGQSAADLATALLNDSYWEANLTAEREPEITLVIDSDDFGSRRYSLRDLQKLTHELHQNFYRRIDERLSITDVFDYLSWVQQRHSIRPNKMAAALNAEAAALIDAGGTPEKGRLVYREPAGAEKKNLAAAIADRLQAMAPLEVIDHYSDRNAITLIKIKKPDLDQIREIRECRDDYLALRSGSLNNNLAHDQQLRRAQVFHPFRQEMEAWYIERYYMKEVNSADVPMLPPRVVRLLEDPEMMQIFVHGIATGAVEIVNLGWVWHGPDRDVVLTDPEVDPNADVVRAAIIFVLKQSEGRRGSLKPIPREDARRSVAESVQKIGRARDEMLVEFVKDKLDAFLKDNAPASLRLALKMVFTFYCDPDTRTGLQYRVNLP